MQLHLEGMFQSLILEGQIFLKCFLDKKGSKETASTFFLVATWAFLSRDFLISIEDHMAGGFPSIVPEHDKALKAPTISQSNTGMSSWLQMLHINQKNLTSPSRSFRTEDLATKCAWYITTGLYMAKHLTRVQRLTSPSHTPE